MSAIDSAIARLAAGQHGVVAAWQLREAGISERARNARLGDGRLAALYRGTYALGHTCITREGRWLGAVLASGPGAALSHRSAGALHDLRRSSRRAVDVIVPGASRRPRPGITVHGHLLHPDDRTIVRGIPVTTAARTLLDMAEVVEPRGVQRAYERAGELRLLAPGELERLLERSNGHRGAGTLSRLLEADLAANAEALSELERMFCDLVREAELPIPQLNVLVEGYLVDACWPDARVVVELQGYEFHHDREAFERDNEKLVRLRLAGYDVLPFTYRAVAEQSQWVASAVTRALAHRGG